MALNSGKILMRRGQEVNFDPNKMMPGEWAVSLDSKFVRMCFSPGVCIRMATYEAFEADMEQIRAILAECQTVEEAVQRIYEDIKDVAVDVERIEAAAASALKSEKNALNSANSASQSANTATQKASEAVGSANIASTKAEQATEGASTATQKASEAAGSADNVRNMSSLSQSYAVGGTGTREGEDTDNAKYYNQQASDSADRAEAAADRASTVADVGVATTEKAGLVRPDGETIRVDLDGTIHADRGTTSYTDLENKPKINDVVLEGEKTLEELGIASKEALEKTDSKVNIIIEQAELRFKETASGENIHLDDSADSKLVEFGLYGKAVQNGTPTSETPINIEVSGESYNLIPYPYSETTHTQAGITWTDNGDGTVTVNGTQTGGYSDFFLIGTDKPMILKAGTYIFNGCLSGGVLDKTYFMLIGSIIDGATTRLASDVGNGATFTINKDTPIWALIRYSETAVATNHVFKPMLRKASIKNDRYMPYGKGSVEVKSIGKNLTPYPYYRESGFASSGITYTYDKKGVITANGISNGVSFFLLANALKEDFPKLVGKTTLSLKSNSGLFSVYIKYEDMNGNMIIEYAVRNKNGSITFDAYDGEYHQIEMGLYLPENTSVTSDKIYVQLESGEASTEYEPYKETASIIQTENGLPGIPVDSDGNYTDSNGQQWIANEIVKYADGSGEKIQRLVTVVFDGSEEWVDRTNDYIDKTNGQKRFSINGLGVRYKPSVTTAGMSNIGFRGMIDGVSNYTEDGVSLYIRMEVPDTKNCYITVSNPDITDLATFKSWLASNNVVLICELETQIITPLTAEEISEIEKLSTFYPVTNISNDFDCGMKVKYIADSKNYIDNQLAIQAKLQEEALLNMLLLMPEEVQASMIENDTNNLLNESEV